MKVFLVHENIYNAGTPYIYTLKENIEKMHSNVLFKWGMDEFWSNNLYEYDIIHFQFPAAFMANDNHLHSLDDFREQIYKAKEHGVKIVATCHDLCPHYTQAADFGDAISIVYSLCDAIFHLGEYSMNLYMQQFPKCQHLLLPHHLYDELYTIRPNKQEAREKLGLSLSKKYILCMGAFRAQEERDLVLFIAKKLRRHGVEIIAPAFDNARISLKKKFPFISHGWLKFIYYRYVMGVHLTGQTWVPISDDDLPYYYAACDMAFVQRLKILNSGNAVMPLLFGIPVCGPNIGNVGVFLKKYGGYTFDVEKSNELPNIISNILFSNRQNNVAHNRDIEQLSTSVIAEKQYNYYEQIIS